jgi:hypothetical protein
MRRFSSEFWGTRAGQVQADKESYCAVDLDLAGSAPVSAFAGPRRLVRRVKQFGG